MQTRVKGDVDTGDPETGMVVERRFTTAVSYTHLPLPTSELV